MEKVTIIIPCRNEEKYIGKCIDSILQQDYPKEDFDVFIVDGESTDRTKDIVQEYCTKEKNIHILDNPEKTAPFAMNIGIENSKGDIIIRMDAHAWYSPKYVSTLVHYLKTTNADNIGCVWITDVLNKTAKTLSIKEVLASPFGVGNSSFRTGTDKIMEADTVPFGCYRREIFEKAGYYNTKLTRNQDIELNKRIKANGGKIYLIPDALCTYYARETFGAIAQNNYRNGLWNILTVKITKNFSSLSLRHFIPLIFLLSLILPSAFAALWWPLCLISALSLTCYLLALCIISLKLAITKKLNFFYLCWTFIVLHFSYATGSLVGIFKHVKK